MAIKGIVAPRIMARFVEGQARLVRIGGFEPVLVDHTFKDSMTKEMRTRKVMRIYLREMDGEAGSWEWTIHSKRLMVVMNELLARPDYKDLLLSVTMVGVPPYTRWDVRAIG